MRSPRMYLTVWRQYSKGHRKNHTLNQSVVRHWSSGGSAENGAKSDHKTDKYDTNDDRPGLFGALFNKFIPKPHRNVTVNPVPAVEEAIVVEKDVLDPNETSDKKFSEDFVNVCEHYKVPSDQTISLKSAIDLIRKICETLEPGESIYEAVTYKQRHVIAELFDEVQSQLEDENEIEFLNDVEVLEIARAIFSLKDIPQTFIKVLQEKVISKLKSRKYSNEQLLDFVKTIEPIGLDSGRNLLQVLFEYITENEKSLDNSLIFAITQLFPKDSLAKFIPTVERELKRLKFHEVFRFTKLAGKDAIRLEQNWAKLYQEGQTEHEVKPEEIDVVLSEFLSSEYVSPGCIKVAHKLFCEMCKNNDECMKIAPQTIASALSYLTLTEHYSEHLLKLSCRHFVENSDKYAPEHVAALVKALGTVNYQPADGIQREFFKRVEEHLLKNLYNLDLEMLLETLGNLVYLGRIPLNFRPYVFAEIFQTVIHDLPYMKLIKCWRLLQILDTVFSIQHHKSVITKKFHTSTLGSPMMIDKDMTDMRNSIIKELDTLFGSDYRVQYLPSPTLHSMYYSVDHTDEKNPAEGLSPTIGPYNFTLVVLDRTSYLGTTNHLLGREVANIRILEEAGYSVVPVHQQDLIRQKDAGRLGDFLHYAILSSLGMTVDSSIATN